MKINIISLLVFTLIGIWSCQKEENNNIVYSSINKQYVFTRDPGAIDTMTDEISLHIDSILSGLINVEFVSTGYKAFDLDGDSINDLGFEIIDLNEFNAQHLPASFDSLAARVQPYTLQVLDNSMYNYADASDFDQPINSSGNWTDERCVLGTFLHAGNFNGKGEKYLGIRFVKDMGFNYGWIKIYLSEHNDTLKIIEYAYNQTLGNEIKTGQME